MTHLLVYVVPDAEALVDACLARLTRLRDEGFEVQVAAPMSSGLQRLGELGFEIRPLPGRASWNAPGWVGAYLILQGAFIERPPTLVHGFGAPWAWIAALAAHRVGTPGVFASPGRHRGPSGSRRHGKLADWVDVYMVHGDIGDRQRLAVAPGKLELIPCASDLGFDAGIDEQVLTVYDRTLSRGA